MIERRPARQRVPRRELFVGRPHHAPEWAAGARGVLARSGIDAHDGHSAVVAALRPHCALELTSQGTAIWSLLTGLSMLARAGWLSFETKLRSPPALDRRAPWHLRDKSHVQARLRIGADGPLAVLDLHDSHELDDNELAECDVYFKRSLLPESALLAHGEKLHALGLMTEIRDEFPSRIELRRELAERRGSLARAGSTLRSWAHALAARVDVGSRPSWSRMHGPPVADDPPTVVCMAGLWDPDEVPRAEVSKRLEWEALNAQRVACIRALRRAFGPAFHGGVRPSNFARRYCPDLLLANDRSAAPQEYRRRVRAAAIGVTTTGLHGSNGYRLAELVAHSRAIVSEPLRHAVPGDFAPGANYLEFRTPDECVERVAQLLRDRAAREAMMLRNWHYAQRWLRPDRMALRVVGASLATSRRARAALR